MKLHIQEKKNHKTKQNKNHNIFPPPIFTSPWLYAMVGFWVHMLVHILARYNCIATVTATTKSQKISLSSLQVIANESDTDRGTAG